jgi:hypothetical protein
VRRIVLIVLALVLVPSIATATSYRCLYDGQTRSACCCPGPEHQAQLPPGAQILRAACCCTITPQTAIARTFDQTAISKLHPVSVPVVVALEPAPVPRLDPAAAIARPHAQAGPPLTLLARHCALLL